MFKPVLGLAATGIAAFFLWKVVALFLLPLVGVAIGLVLVVIKVAFWVLAGCFAWWLFKRMTRHEPAAA